MDYEKIRIDLEANLSQELFDLFEGNIVAKIMHEGKVEGESNSYQSILEGHSFKITPKLASKLNDLCVEVQEALRFEEKIDFFITNSPEVNCSVISRREPGQSNLIMIKSGLIELFDDDELRFVIGHEIGHLISKNSELLNIIEFIFPSIDRVPIIFQNKIALWQKLSELSADRYGFIASPNLEKCISNFFKLASGLSTLRIAFDPTAYLEEMDKVLEFFRSQPLMISTSHPVNPVRIKALQLFSESKLFSQIVKRKTLEEDKSLDEKINELIQILLIMERSNLDVHRRHFVATGGLIVSGADQQVSLEELNEIVDVLSQYTVFPKQILDEIYATGKVMEIFETSVQAILNQNPSERYAMFEYLVGIALADKEFGKDEVDLLYQLGEKNFGLTPKEIAQRIGFVIQQRFIPRLFH